MPAWLTFLSIRRWTTQRKQCLSISNCLSFSLLQRPQKDKHKKLIFRAQVTKMCSNLLDFLVETLFSPVWLTVKWIFIINYLSSPVGDSQPLQTCMQLKELWTSLTLYNRNTAYMGEYPPLIGTNHTYVYNYEYVKNSWWQISGIHSEAEQKTQQKSGLPYWSWKIWVHSKNQMVVCNT